MAGVVVLIVGTLAGIAAWTIFCGLLNWLTGRGGRRG